MTGDHRDQLSDAVDALTREHRNELRARIRRLDSLRRRQAWSQSAASLCASVWIGVLINELSEAAVPFGEVAPAVWLVVIAFAVLTTVACLFTVVIWSRARALRRALLDE